MKESQAGLDLEVVLGTVTLDDQVVHVELLSKRHLKEGMTI